MQTTPTLAVKTRRSRIWLAVCLLLAFAWLCYSPGLTGGFLFDDYVNLDALGKHGRVDNWPAFWLYITSGTADPTGRPLAMLTFLLDANDWPADPAPFLRTNLILHLGNGILLFLLLRRLECLLGAGRNDTRKDLIALLGSALWLLHPLLVSTTLYIVQREAMLPATFILLGLIAYVDGRKAFVDSHGQAGSWRMVLAIGAGTLLAILCKGNGALLPLLALTLVVTSSTATYPHETGDAAARRLRSLDRLLLILPSLAILAYLLALVPQMTAELPSRPWTIAQRLLTEPRVLLDYLRLLIVPRSVSTGLFNDEYPVAVSWTQPATTIPALATVMAIIGMAIHWRAKTPRLSAAVLFFFAGHVLESTVMPLEIYFEHRNYLPALLFFWPLAYGMVSLAARPWVRISLAAVLIGVFGLTTWQRAHLWGNPPKLAALWALQNQDSPRAQASAAIALMQENKPAEALALIQPLWRRHPEDIQLAFNYVNAACSLNGLGDSDVQAVRYAIQHTGKGQLLVTQWLSGAMSIAADGHCHNLDLEDVGQWVDAALRNPNLSARGQRGRNLEPLLGELSVHKDEPAKALVHFKVAVASNPTPDLAAREAAFMASHGHYEQALALLDYYEQFPPPTSTPAAGMAWLHGRVLEWQDYWPRELAALRAKLNAEIAARPSSQAPALPDMHFSAGE